MACRVQQVAQPSFWLLARCAAPLPVCPSAAPWRALFRVSTASPAEGQAWWQPDAGLVMLNRGVDGDAAVVSICRKGGPETPESCAAGIDFDCSGLAGPDDPACQAFQTAA